MTRVLTGAVLAALAVAAILLAPAWLFWSLLVLITFLAVHELNGLLDGATAPTWPFVAAVGAPLLVLSLRPGAAGAILVLASLLVLALVRSIGAADEPERAAKRLASTVFAIVYVGVPFAHMGLLFDAGSPSAGRHLLLFAIAVTYAGDTAAYYGGRAFGRRPLAPRISPNKTWAGAVFGVAGASAAGGLAGIALAPHLPFGLAVLLGGAAGAAGIVGDLGESLIKRAAGAKDSGGLLPGHGGVLDRLDSLMLAAPLVFWAERLLFPAA